MAITFVGSNKVEGTTTETLTLPTHQTDDLGIILFFLDTNASPPGITDWTELDNTVFNEPDATPVRVRVYYRVFTSASETDPSIDTSGRRHFAAVNVYRGVDTASPFSTVFTTNTYSEASSLTTHVPLNAAIAATGATVLLYALAGDTDIAISAATPPSGYTTAEYGNYNWIGGVTGHSLSAAVGTETPAAWSVTTVSQPVEGYGYTIALQSNAVTWEGASDISVTGSLSASAGAIRPATASFSATATLSAAPLRHALAEALLSASASLSATGSRGTSGACSLAVTGSLSAQPLRLTTGTVALSATASLSTGFTYIIQWRGTVATFTTDSSTDITCTPDSSTATSYSADETPTTPTYTPDTPVSPTYN